MAHDRLPRVLVATLVATALMGAARASAHSSHCCVPFYEPGNLSFSADGRYAYVADYANTLALRRDPASGALSLIDSYDGGGEVAELSPDQRHLYSTSPRASPDVQVFAVNSGSGELTPAGRWRTSGSAFKDIQARDNRTLYLTDDSRDSLVILDRDPESGALTMRRELRNGHDGVEGLSGPTGMAMSPDGGWLYVWQRTSPRTVSAFRISADGDLTPAPAQSCECSGWFDLVLSADGTRLFAGNHGPATMVRDPATGALAGHDRDPIIGSGLQNPADGVMAISSDGAALYAVDSFQQKAYQLDVDGTEPTVRREYGPGSDGSGWSSPVGIYLSPDERHAYVTTSRAESPGHAAGGIAVFDRSATTGELTFTSLFVGPFFDGQAHDPERRPSMAINDGDDYTNDRDVIVDLRNLPPSTMFVKVSNDENFERSVLRRADDTAVVPWTLDSSGPGRRPKTVYVQLAGASSATPPLSDEIVLDERPPVVLAARIAGGIRVKARDTLSGISHVQVTRKARTPGKWQKFASRIAKPRGRGPVLVRVRDRAGNRSKWREAR